MLLTPHAAHLHVVAVLCNAYVVAVLPNANVVAVLCSARVVAVLPNTNVVAVLRHARVVAVLLTCHSGLSGPTSWGGP